MSHHFEQVVSKRGEHPEARCSVCGLSRRIVGILKADPVYPHAALRTVYLYRALGGYSWATYYPLCVRAARRAGARS